MHNDNELFSPEELQNPFDAIFAIGYRVNSYETTQFRIWTRPSVQTLTN